MCPAHLSVSHNHVYSFSIMPPSASHIHASRIITRIRSVYRTPHNRVYRTSHNRASHTSKCLTYPSAYSFSVTCQIVYPFSVTCPIVCSFSDSHPQVPHVSRPQVYHTTKCLMSQLPIHSVSHIFKRLTYPSAHLFGVVP